MSDMSVKWRAALVEEGRGGGARVRVLRLRHVCINSPLTPRKASRFYTLTLKPINKVSHEPLSKSRRLSKNARLDASCSTAIIYSCIESDMAVNRPQFVQTQTQRFYSGKHAASTKVQVSQDRGR